ncbi:MAG: polysaccharide deacetylase family protein [Acidobacteriaceae bacterium]|nr:polysaccharide deacetylase family protein [Acidobacteriaceae bacterium]
MPWDNHSAAVSLTFDDARPVQLDVAVPELNKRHLHATFFVIVSKLTRLDDWRKAQLEGHEIGNHSLTHPHPDVLAKADEELQVEDAKLFLDSNFHSDILVFAYPYSEMSSGFGYWVKRYDFAARGWRGDGNLLYVSSDTDPDWYNLPSQPAYTKYGLDAYKSWIEKAESMHAWTTLQIHGIGDPSTGFEPIPTATFTALLDYLKAEQDKGLWVGPFGQVAAYLRAQRVLEKARLQVAGNEERLSWDLPKPFPTGVVLKVTMSGNGRTRLFQGNRELRRAKDGTYAVSFDAKELTIRGRA